MSGTAADRDATSTAGSERENLAPWSTDPYTDALRNGHGPLFLRRTDGWLLPLDVERWCAEADAADLSALRRCEGPVLDIGCGPGRLVAELASRGHRALGIDVSAAAVAHTLRVGGSALHRSVFDPLPGEGRWGTVLLIDGNIGIGGDPHGLLQRTADLLAPGGLLIAETSPLDIDERVQVRLYDGRLAPEGTGEEDRAATKGALFPWARLGTPALLRYAQPNAWRAVDQWVADGRPFIALRRTRRVRTPSQNADTANNAAVISSQFPRNTSGESPLAGL
ncbi:MULTISPECIES: methyltransferase domain-containing protein [unclassified Streptomyces]|uniref:class I SAM-dependent methyltransferase n=1 Tax=unclassified Streptomyces TaxID=2593676 RepID=UPI002B1CE1FB|nr:MULTISPECIES: methyltransferase domain-containing protein [unclassified Streptomyces]